MIDRTAESPTQYRVRTRDPAEVDLAVLHQTGPIFDPVRVRAHFLVMPDGDTLALHPPLVRMRYGSGKWNARCVTIEHAAHYPGRYTARGEPKWAGWNERAKPACEPRGRLEDHEAQVHAARALLAHLRETLPALRYVAAHRMIEAGKGGCPGPDLWREVGEWSIRALGLQLAEVEPTGSTLPPTWRAEPRILDAAEPTNRTYLGPLDV